MIEGARSGFTRASLIVLGLGLLFSLMVVGAVEAWALAVMATASAVAFALGVADSGISPKAGLRWWERTETWLTAMVLWGLLQTVPLPAGFHRSLSPEGSRLFALGVALEDRDAARSLSLVPHATSVAVLQGTGLLLAYLLVAATGMGQRTLAAVLWGLVAFAGAATVTGILDFIGGTAFLRLYPREMDYPGRLTGPFVNPNTMAAFLVLLAPVALGLLAREGAGPSRPGGRGRRGTKILDALRQGPSRGWGAATAVVGAVLILGALLT
ncbi:MAG: hypothetical protein ACYTG4_02925, partial [Planctomycetota bacterium]